MIAIGSFRTPFIVNRTDSPGLPTAVVSSDAHFDRFSTCHGSRRARSVSMLPFAVARITQASRSVDCCLVRHHVHSSGFDVFLLRRFNSENAKGYILEGSLCCTRC